MKNETLIRSSLKSWICQSNGKIRPEELTDQTPIIEQRILSSLQVMEFILFVDSLRGAPVDLQRLGPGVLKDIDTIYHTFFEGADHVA